MVPLLPQNLAPGLAASENAIVRTEIAEITAEAKNLIDSVGQGTIRFGRDANQVGHAFRHIDALGLDRAVVQSAIENHLATVGNEIAQGIPFNQIIEVAGRKIQYTAFKLPNGAINIGRIHGTP